MNMIKKLVKEEEGQALTEYGLILGLIAVAVIAAAGLLGKQISGMFTYITGKLNIPTG